jgi:hypothetical protein
VAFFVHDLGYLGKPDMDGEEGERHVILGAKIMQFLFDNKHGHCGRAECAMAAGMGYPSPEQEDYQYWADMHSDLEPDFTRDYNRAIALCRARCRDCRQIRYGWRDFTLLHSRFWAKQMWGGAPPSRLCFADKLAFCLTPRWLYLPMVGWSGEILEYMSRASKEEGSKYASMNLDASTRKAWHESVRIYLLAWIAEHKDGRDDAWTGRG